MVWRLSPACRVLSLWQATQYWSRRARWVAPLGGGVWAWLSRPETPTSRVIPTPATIRLAVISVTLPRVVASSLKASRPRLAALGGRRVAFAPLELNGICSPPWGKPRSGRAPASPSAGRPRPETSTTDPSAIDACEYQGLDEASRQKIAIGLTGDPVPPGTRSGATTSMNSQRFRPAAVSAAASRSRLSSRFIPRDTIANR